MAYRWRNGWLMSDEEIARDDQLTWASLVHVGAAVGPTLLAGYLAHRLGGALVMLLGAGAGAWLTWAFYPVVVLLWRAALVLGIVLGFLAFLGYFLRVFWDML